MSSSHVTFCQKIDFQTHYISSKFHCDCLNILEVMEEGGYWKPSLNTYKWPILKGNQTQVVFKTICFMTHCILVSIVFRLSMVSIVLYDLFLVHMKHMQLCSATGLNGEMLLLFCVNK